ncbi:hypothetical protein LBMAG33_2710 [Candidatus Levyibacteriota bacterium]|nr:hypothetical protein [Candidatus Levybacteria bacterium]MSU25919.1 hypothetical protein [Candidatus Levybacteria bacterium]GDX61961.1 hypothetical protein LBMAG33_2710 [Candidatus Levybacteria bacterium]
MQEINEPISVIFIYNSKKRYAKPYKINWKEKDYIVEEVCIHYFQEKKGIFHHIYVIKSGNTIMEIIMNSRTLFWEIERIGDLLQ